MKTNIQLLKFILIGVAGLIAPRHLKAIKDVNGELIAALDKSDSVGILDSYFPNAKFFTDFENKIHDVQPDIDIHFLHIIIWIFGKLNKTIGFKVMKKNLHYDFNKIRIKIFS